MAARARPSAQDGHLIALIAALFLIALAWAIGEFLRAML